MVDFKNISDNISYRISKYVELDKNQQLIIAYGAYTLISGIFSITLTIVFGYIFKVMIEAAICSLTVGIIRKYSGGVHATSLGRCAFLGTLLSVGLGLIAAKILSKMNNVYIISFFVASIIYVYFNVIKLAPVDSAAKPIKSLERRKRLKIESIVSISVIYIVDIVMIILFLKFRTSLLIECFAAIMLGALWQAFTLTITGHKVITYFDNLLKNIWEVII